MSIGKMKGRPTAEICADCSAPGMILYYFFHFKCSAFLILLPFSLNSSSKHELPRNIFFPKTVISFLVKEFSQDTNYLKLLRTDTVTLKQSMLHTDS